MRVHQFMIVLACFAIGLAIPSDSRGGELKPYPLPPEARTGVEKLAASSDVLVLGEMHGTQEVPQLVAGLLAPLSELGYHALALEVPNNQQAAVLAWARGETKTIPGFFAFPNADGRGNAQLLALARIAAVPPFRWQIICFDESELTLEKQARLALAQRKQTEKAKGSELAVDDEMFALWRERDATMAANVLRETKSLKPTEKTLAICGNIHARVTKDVRDPMLSKLWPSFAEMLKQRRPAWRVNSINIEFYSGAIFNEGKVRSIGKRPLEHAVIRSAGQSGCTLVLSLPVATPATFGSEKPGSREDQVAKSQAGGDK
jgi:erythromycin esterase-like protein